MPISQPAKQKCLSSRANSRLHSLAVKTVKQLRVQQITIYIVGFIEVRFINTAYTLTPQQFLTYRNGTSDECWLMCL